MIFDPYEKPEKGSKSAFNMFYQGPQILHLGNNWVYMTINQKCKIVVFLRQIIFQKYVQTYFRKFFFKVFDELLF